MDPDLRPQNNPTPNPQNIYNMQSPEQPSPVVVSHQKRSKGGKKKWWIISGIVVLVIAALAAGWLYYTNPSRVLADVVKGVSTTKTADYNGRLTLHNKEGNLDAAVELNGQASETAFTANTSNQISFGAIDLNVDLSVAAEGETAYIKLNNASEVGDLIQTLLQNNPYFNADTMTPLFEELEDTWLSLNNESGEDLGVANTCDPKQVSEWFKNENQTLRDLFGQNQFIKAERTGGFSLTGQQYSLSVDKQVAQAFLDQVSNMESFQKIEQECGELSFDTSKLPDVKADIWVNRWSHDLERAVINVDSEEYEMTLDIYPGLDKPVNIQMPTDAKTLEEIFGEYMQGQMQEQLEAQGETTIPQTEAL